MRTQARPSIRTVAERNRLVVENLRLVNTVLSRHWHVRDDATAADSPAIRRCGGYDDAYQAGVRGLMRAAELYDPATGQFSTYAFLWIKNEIRRATQHGGVVSVPHRILAEGGMNADRAGMNAYRAGAAVRAAAPADDLLGLADGAPAADADLIRRETESRLRAAIARLPPKVRAAVRLYYLRGLLLREVGDRLGLTRQRAQQLTKQGLHALRKALAD